MIRFQCPGCQATYTVGDEKAGKQGKCPKCQSAFIIPGAEASAPPPPAPPALPPPPPPVEEEGIEISPCPKCGTRLTVSAGDIGLNVQCPSCSTTFQAARPGSMAPVPPPPAPFSTDDDDRPARRRRRDDDDDSDRETRRSRRTGTVEIRRISVVGGLKMGAAIGFAYGCVIGFLYGGFLATLGLAGAAGPGGGGGAGAMAGAGLCIAILAPILYCLVGFVAGLVGAIVYNLVANATGGIEVDLR